MGFRTFLLASSLPTLKKKRVWHVGSLGGPKKIVGGMGNEGDGLSVSEHPEAWRRIARLGGQDIWLLEKPGGVFVDAVKALKSSGIKKALYDWALEHKLAVPSTIWRVVSTDEEGGERYSEYDNERAARAEADDEESVTEIPGRLKASKEMDRWYRGFTKSALEPVMLDDMLLFRYAEELGAHDGLWWNEILDPVAYSAPRGAIFQGKLAGWSKKVATGRDLPEEDEEY